MMSIQDVSAEAVAASPQTLTIIGAQGTIGETDPYTEFSLDKGLTWRRAFLYGSHPWGFVDGTNSWMNCGPSGGHCLGVNVLYRVQFNLPDDFSNPQTTFQFKADNAVTIDLNNNRVGHIEGQGTVTGDTYSNSKLMPGLNEVRMLLRDDGGWAGLNYKITINVDASSAPTLVTAPLSVLPAPTLTSSPATPTRENVSVTILYPADAIIKEYSFNEVDWFNYPSAIVMINNGTIYARWKDAIGIPSTTGAHTISNIDKTPPIAPTFWVTPPTLTNGNVEVTITFPADSVLNKYQIGTGAVQDYTDPITISANGSVTAYAVDAAGNTIDAMLTVDNIDTTAPSMPSLTANTTNPTNSPVRVTITNWGDAIVKEYRIDGGVWQSAMELAEVVMTANGTVEARGKDSAGNESSIGLIAINNIMADLEPLKVTVAAMNADGTEMTILFNHKLDLHTPLNKEKFHLNGADASISSVRYVSDQVVELQLHNSDAVTNGPQTITLDVDYGAVMDNGSKLILEWKGLPVKSQMETNSLRDQLRTFSTSNPNGAIRINNVVGYMVQSPSDVTGDGVFDRNDVLFLLLQIDPLAARQIN
jgi:hypothetical protein